MFLMGLKFEFEFELGLVNQLVELVGTHPLNLLVFVSMLESVLWLLKSLNLV